MRKTEVLLPQSLFADLDRVSGLPLYKQVAQKLEVAIREGTLPPGSRIENEVSLAERLKLSRPTIRRAIQSLVDGGLVVRRRGIGSQVVRGQVTRGLDIDPELVNVHGGAIALGHPIGTSGTRIVGTLARQLQSLGSTTVGAAGICGGGGQGAAMVLQAL